MKLKTFFGFLFLTFVATSARAVVPDDALSQDQIADVELDAHTLFRVRGMTGFPAEERAKAIVSRIRDFAASGKPTETLKVENLPEMSRILGGDIVLVTVIDADAELEHVSRPIFAERSKMNIAEAVNSYRRDRSRPVLLRRLAVTFGATALLWFLLSIDGRLFRQLRVIAEQHVKTRIDNLKAKSFQFFSTGSLWGAILSFIGTLQLVVSLVIFYVYLNFVLGLFPWTRALALRLFSILVEPLQVLGGAFVDSLPSLIFLAILFLITRYILKAAGLFFIGIDKGIIQFDGFDQDWALPTNRIVRFLIIAFALVVAYPYIPGSNSDAFKGVSLFIGVIFSLGSSSFIANIIAGTTMTYRRAFKIGDRIKVNDLMGVVTDVRQQVTHLRTIKNEEITIPNSVMLSSHILNYSVMTKKGGLILHTSVRIGYDTPWRKVEAILLNAADKTEGLLKEPKPFVLQWELGEFGVKYEINAYCDDASKIISLYTRLHQNILDSFNEQGVQIMTPAYEGDPETPKLVAKDKWFPQPNS